MRNKSEQTLVAYNGQAQQANKEPFRSSRRYSTNNCQIDQILAKNSSLFFVHDEHHQQTVQLACFDQSWERLNFSSLCKATRPQWLIFPLKDVEIIDCSQQRDLSFGTEARNTDCQRMRKTCAIAERGLEFIRFAQLRPL